jgi:hypothetical protein
LPKRFDVNLGINFRSVCSPMPHEVSNRLEGEAGVNKMLNTGVSQRVRAWARNADSGFAEMPFGSQANGHA